MTESVKNYSITQEVKDFGDALPTDREGYVAFRHGLIWGKEAAHEAELDTPTQDVLTQAYTHIKETEGDGEFDFTASMERDEFYVGVAVAVLGVRELRRTTGYQRSDFDEEIGYVAHAGNSIMEQFPVVSEEPIPGEAS